MKLKIKALAAAAVMAVAGQASAALSDTFVTDGTLFLTVWDTTTFKSYTRDLGVSLDGFLPSGALTAEAGANVGAGQFNFGSPSSLFSTTFTGATASNLRWTIVAVDQITGEGAGNGSRVASVYNTAPTLFNNGVVRGMATNTVNFAGDLINNSGVDFSGAPAEYAVNGTGTQAIEGAGPGWGLNMGGASPNQAYGVGFGTAQFWYAQTTDDNSASSDSLAVTPVRYGNSANFATFSLATDGTVTYSLAAAAVAAVPLPAAFWMMGAGLLGFGGAARRRKAAAAAAQA